MKANFQVRFLEGRGPVMALGHSTRAVHTQTLPEYLSSDHDLLYRFHQWQANLRVLEVTEIKTVPYVPLSHPFVEGVIGTVRWECLDRPFFWTATDLEAKLTVPASRRCLRS